MWTEEKPGTTESDVGDLFESAPSAAIALQLSETLGRDVTDIEPIGNKIDTDALNRLVRRSASADFRFEFTHEGCRVELDNRTVRVSELDETSE